MVTFGDDEEIGNGYPDNSSEDDNDEPMDDAEDGDADGDGDQNHDPDGEGDGEGDDNDDDGDNDDEDDQDETMEDTPSRRRAPAVNGVGASHGANEPRKSNHPTVSFTSPSPRASPSAQMSPIFRPSIRQEAIDAISYDIVPTMAAPHSTSINALTATPDMRWIFTGGTDGYIRKFSWADTVNGKLPLTVAQRHPFVDSVTKAGVLLSYWENYEYSTGSTSAAMPQEQNNDLSSVYSLAVHNQALWLLSGLESGGINIQSVRHQEGKRITCLRKHTSAVSVMKLSQDEKSLLSGSWDKTILDWDLNTGDIKRSFTGSGGQISSIEPRPISSLPVPEESGISHQSNGTYSSNYSARTTLNGVLPNGISSLNSATGKAAEGAGGAGADSTGSPGGDSLFGDNDSLFGDDKDVVTGAHHGGGAFGEDDEDEFSFSKAIASEMRRDNTQGANSRQAMDLEEGGPVQAPSTTGAANGADASDPSSSSQQDAAAAHRRRRSSSEPLALANGIPRSFDGAVTNSTAEEQDPHKDSTKQAAQQQQQQHHQQSAYANETIPASETTFLDASIDGTLRVWDRRQPNPIARIYPTRATPPWCMDACWSHDGNFVYAGRRNGTVDEYSLHKGLREPSRTFKFPGGSGPVSALRPMPNGKHLVCASYDILRLYDLREQDPDSRHSVVPFLIVPGHRTGIISQLFFDPTCSFMVSIAGNRGWEGQSTEVLLGYEIGAQLADGAA